MRYIVFPKLREEEMPFRAFVVSDHADILPMHFQETGQQRELALGAPGTEIVSKQAYPHIYQGVKYDRVLLYDVLLKVSINSDFFFS